MCGDKWWQRSVKYNKIFNYSSAFCTNKMFIVLLYYTQLKCLLSVDTPHLFMNACRESKVARINVTLFRVSIWKSVKITMKYFIMQRKNKHCFYDHNHLMNSWREARVFHRVYLSCVEFSLCGYYNEIFLVRGFHCVELTMKVFIVCFKLLLHSENSAQWNCYHQNRTWKDANQVDLV